MNEDPPDFVFPKSYAYPPMWSVQRVVATRERQYRRWSDIILAYCRNARIWRFRLVEMLDTPLFHNRELRKCLSLQEVRDIIDWMTRDEGLKRAEWVSDGIDKSVAWIYWRRPDEWAEIILNWVEESGQKNTVFTLFELTQGESTTSQEFYTMDPDVFQKALQVLVKRGKASIFSSRDELGVKFY